MEKEFQYRRDYSKHAQIRTERSGNYKLIEVLISIFLVLFSFVSTASAAVMNITSSEDTFILEGSTNNYGNITLIDVGHSVADLENGLVKFDLSSVPSHATINSATLYLYEHTGGNLGYVQSIYNVTSSWDELTVNWNTRPTFNPTAFTSANGLASAGWMNWNVKSTVQAWYLGNLVNNGFLLNETVQPILQLEYLSRDYTIDTTLRPYLSIDYTIPAYKKGDVNQDGSVNIVDALFVSQYTVGARTLTSSQFASADVNGDGQVNIIDALFIAQYTVGIRQIFQNWVTKEHDFNHTGISNSVDVLTPTIKWKKAGVVGTYDEWGGVIVVDGIIYTVPMTTETNMYAIYSNNQTIKWSFNIGKTNAPAMYYNHIIYVINMAGNLIALNEDGSEKWSKNVPTPFATGAMTISEKDNALFVSQGNPLKLYSYDLDTGNENWNVFLPWGNDVRTACSITFGTIYNNGIVYLSGYSCMDTSYLAAYYSNNGTQLWNTAPAGIIENDKRSIYIWDSDILIYNNIIYIGIHNINLNYNVIAVYPNNGSLKWGKKTGNTLTTPKIYNGILWTVASLGGAGGVRVYGLNPDTGDIIYNSPLDADDNSFESYMTPVLGANYFYFTTTGGSHNKLYAFDYNGNNAWSYDFGSTTLYSQGALVNGELYITADDTNLYGFKG